MYVWSKVLAVALAVTLCGYGATALQAKNHKNHNNQCQKPEGCPAPVIQQPTVESSCCPIPPVQSRCAPPPQEGCCGVVDNSADFDKAHKEALKAYHEAQEACKKRQAAIAKAQHEIAEKVAKQQSRIDRANDHFNHELSELQEANARYEAVSGGPSEAVVETTPPAVAPQPMPQPEPEVTRSKPEPEPEPITQAQPQQSVIEEQVAILEPPPAPAPQTEPAPSEKPKELPKTASPFNLIGLIGLASMSSAYATRFFRR